MVAHRHDVQISGTNKCKALFTADLGVQLALMSLIFPLSFFVLACKELFATVRTIVLLFINTSIAELWITLWHYFPANFPQKI